MSVELPSGLLVAEDLEWEREWGELVSYEEPRPLPAPPNLWEWFVVQGITIMFLDGTERGPLFTMRVLREAFSAHQTRIADDVFQPSPFHAWIAKNQV